MAGDRPIDPEAAAGSPLPGPIDSVAFARGRRELLGRIESDRLGRVVEAGAATADGVRWSAVGSTGRDAHDRLREFLTIRVDFTPILRCARCLEPMTLAPIAAESRFRFAATEDQAAREDREEADCDVIAHDPALDLGALIEDEVLLSLPMLAAHDQCPDPL
jgi:uncharacterized protein